MTIRKSLIPFATSLIFCSLSFAADDQTMTLEQLNQVSQLVPELAEDKSTEQNRVSAPRMKCFVDTPAFDNFSFGFCASVASPFSTTAFFRIDNVPSNFTIIWSDSRCNSSSRDCLLPISIFQTINLSATVLNNSTGTFSTTSASALYENFF